MGALKNRLRAFQVTFVYDSVNYEGGMIEVAVLLLRSMYCRILLSCFTIYIASSSFLES